MVGSEGERPEGDSGFHPVFRSGEAAEGVQEFHSRFPGDGSKPEGYGELPADLAPVDESDTDREPHFEDGSKPEGYNEIPK